MRVISIANNANNSRATIEFTGFNVLSIAHDIAVKHKCMFSHNVTRPPATEKDPLPISFGSVSFNHGDHASALAEFVKKLTAN
jgi:hypothetical protein